LEYIRSYPLTLLEAPYGFGKTTALQNFFDHKVSQDVPVYWYIFRDKNPLNAWSGLCGLIGTFDSANAKRLLDASLPDEDNLPLIENILQELQCPEETYLVLDNFQSWKLKMSGLFLMTLSCHSAQNLHVMIATQPLPWSSIR